MIIQLKHISSNLSNIRKLSLNKDYFVENIYEILENKPNNRVTYLIYDDNGEPIVVYDNEVYIKSI